MCGNPGKAQIAAGAHWKKHKKKGQRMTVGPSLCVARPERFELPTTKFVAWCSIQLSYGRPEPEL